jgi:hypothetical protein
MIFVILHTGFKLTFGNLMQMQDPVIPFDLLLASLKRSIGRKLIAGYKIASPKHIPKYVLHFVGRYNVGRHRIF